MPKGKYFIAKSLLLELSPKWHLSWRDIAKVKNLRTLLAWQGIVEAEKWEHISHCEASLERKNMNTFPATMEEFWPFQKIMLSDLLSSSPFFWPILFGAAMWTCFRDMWVERHYKGKLMDEVTK
ncbi:Uncharacterized protein Fot_49627 [Forsythia ovata]|uniref:Uncharacterized protein n=1 Tax=Forsythia ovata TaxID=205694 RepID=A0ABD1QGJ3_9LAMI